MEIKQVIVYPCSYCSDLIYFDNPKELAYHIMKNHLQQAITLLAKESKEIAEKKNMKWCLT